MFNLKLNFSILKSTIITLNRFQPYHRRNLTHWLFLIATILTRNNTTIYMWRVALKALNGFIYSFNFFNKTYLIATLF